MKLTIEQRNIIDISKSMEKNEVLKIQACAGSGKTATLCEIARANNNARFLYLAFNKKLAIEATRKFPNNVTSMTTHKLAYLHIIHNKGYKVENNIDLMVLQKLRVDNVSEFYGKIKSFLHSKKRYFNDNAIELLFEMARNGEMPYSHDMYLKEYQMLTREQKGLECYDFIMLDEAQDINEATLSIFLDNACKKILVGDTYQNIYTFRGTNEVNALEKVSANYDKTLSYSFRCSQDILDKACFFINKYKKKKEKFISHRNGNFSNCTKALITRTNASIIEKIAENLTSNNKIKYRLIRQPDEIFKASKNLLYFRNNQQENISKQFKWFLECDDLTSIRIRAESMNDLEIISGIDLVKKYGNQIIALEEEAVKLYDTSDFDITITTAHTAKGLEWDRVELHSDFAELCSIKYNIANYYNRLQTLKSLKEYKQMLELETNIYYVAITRARYELIDNTQNAKEYKSCHSPESAKDSGDSNNFIAFSDDEREVLQEK